MRWPETSAAAPGTSRSTRRSSSRRRGCGARRRSRSGRRSMGSNGSPRGFKTIGRPIRRIDGRSKVTGLTKFADDLFMPRMLFCRILRSTVPHARIKSIDVSAALAKPGVHAVLTGKDFPIPFGILPVSQDEHALCTDKVRFVGDPVAAVAAVDEDTAFDALDLIKVEYEPLA